GIICQRLRSGSVIYPCAAIVVIAKRIISYISSEDKYRAAAAVASERTGAQVCARSITHNYITSNYNDPTISSKKSIGRSVVSAAAINGKISIDNDRMRT